MNSLMPLCSVIGVVVKHGSAPEYLREDFHGLLGILDEGRYALGFQGSLDRELFHTQSLA
jgi:hypothetical protein